MIERFENFTFSSVVPPLALTTNLFAPEENASVWLARDAMTITMAQYMMTSSVKGRITSIAKNTAT